MSSLRKSHQESWWIQVLKIWQLDNTVRIFIGLTVPSEAKPIFSVCRIDVSITSITFDIYLYCLIFIKCIVLHLTLMISLRDPDSWRASKSWIALIWLICFHWYASQEYLPVFYPFLIARILRWGFLVPWLRGQDDSLKPWPWILWSFYRLGFNVRVDGFNLR